MEIFFRNFDATYWNSDENQLSVGGVLLSSTEFVSVNPITIAMLGGDKLATFSPSQIISNFILNADAPNISVPVASDYTFYNWGTAGWDINGDFVGEIRNWIQNNLTDPVFNSHAGTVNILFLYGPVKGVNYALALVYTGNNGATQFPVDNGTFLNTNFPQTVDSGQFGDVPTDTIDGGTF